jgi:hypothetical protein
MLSRKLLLDDNFLTVCSILSFPLTSKASILACIYQLLGEPSANHHDPVSWEKVVSQVTHWRKEKGFIIDTQQMEVSIPNYKWDHVVELLEPWLVRPSYIFLEAAELLGTLNTLSKICRWACSPFFALQQDACRILQLRCHALANWRTRHASQIKWRMPDE